MYLLDSNIPILMIRGHEGVARLVGRLAGEGSLTISVLTRFEVLSGMRPQETSRTLEILGALETFLVTPPIADLGGQFWRRYRARGRTLSRFDTLIAATAVVEDQTLVTLNVRDYPMPEVRLYRRTW